MRVAVSVLVGLITFVAALVGLALLTRFAVRTLDELAIWIWRDIGLSAALGVLSFLLAWWELNRARS